MERKTKEQQINELKEQAEETESEGPNHDLHG